MFYSIKNYVHGEKLEVGRTSQDTNIIITAEGVKVDHVFFPFKDFKLIFKGSRHNLVIDTKLGIPGFEFIMQRILETKYDKVEVAVKDDRI